MAARLTAEEHYLRSFPETWVQQQIKDRAAAYKFWYYHPPDNKPDRHGHKQQITPGFPDTVLIRGERIVFIEAKTHQGQTTDDQDAVLNMLMSTGKVEVYIIRPQQVFDGTLDQILRPDWAKQ